MSTRTGAGVFRGGTKDRILARLAACALLVLAAPVVRGSDTGTGVGMEPMPTPQFRQYEVSDGLPSSNVYNVVQDRRGLLWMGTKNGLVHFDGVHFKVYRHDPRNPHSLAGNDISAVIIDHRQRLWVGGDGTGLNLFNPATGDFRTWWHVEGDSDSISGNGILALAEGADGSIWISVTGRGLDRMRPDGSFEHFRHDPKKPDSLASDILLSLRALKDGSLLIGTTHGLDRMAADGHIGHVRFEGLGKPPRVWGINGKPGHLRLATDAGLFKLDADGVARRMLVGVLPATLMTTSARGPDGSLWVGGLEGLYWIGADGRHRHFPPQSQSRDGVPGTLIWSLTFDSEGGLWVTTRDGGVAYLGPVWKQFIVFQRRLGDAGGLSMDRVTSILADRGQLLVGGNDGSLDRVDPATGRIEHENLGHQDGSVMALARAGHGDLWIGRTSGMQLRTGDRVIAVGGDTFPGGINRAVTDRAGNAYVSAPAEGVFRVDRKTLAVTRLRFKDSDPDADDVNSMLMHNGHLWVASTGGLYRQQGDSMVKVSGVLDGRALGFTFDADGVWVVRSDSLDHYLLFGTQASRDRVVDANEGWPEVDVVALSCDPEGRVWLTTRTGLWRFDPKTGGFRSFGADDGLPSPEFTAYRMVRLPDGTEYTGTMHGVVGWNPATVRDHPRPPRLMLDRITVKRDGVVHALPITGRTLQLRWNDRELHVVAQAISYLDPKRNHYRFRMDGVDSGWVDTGPRGERDFTNLPHGDYTLHVQAAGPSGAWASLPPLSIHVAHPPWMTWWAWLGYVLVGLSVVLVATLLARRRIEQRHRVQMAERERSMAEKASAAKSSFLATLGHEIRTPMTGVLGMAELLLRSPLEPRQREYAETIQRSGTVLLRLVNEALDMARIEAGRLELDIRPFAPREVMRDVMQLERGLAEAKGLAISSEIDERIPAELYGDAVRIKQILLNLLNNALKFTEQGSIRVRMEWLNEGLSLSVIDTGPGVPEDSRQRLFRRYEQADSPHRSSGSGLGLAICRELTLLMGGRCELADTGPHGSTFRVWLPLDAACSPDVVAAAMDDGRHRWNLLLVEDDLIVAGVIRGLLEDMGHHVRHAPHGLAALSELETGACDAALVDLDLPGLDGFALARMLRERGLTLPLIAITARSGGDEEARSRAAGMDAFLRKPISGAQLQAVLQQLLARA